MKAKFGVYPEKMIDLQALCGDSTDNVPGVPGIGAKTAAQLLDEYGDLETLLARAGEIKQQQAAREPDRIRRAGAHLAQAGGALQRGAARRAARRSGGGAVDGPQAVGFCKAMEFNALMRRVADKTGADIDAVEPAALVIEGWPPEGGAAGARARHGRLRRPFEARFARTSG